VNDLNFGVPATFNPDGIIFAQYGDDAGDAAGTFFLPGGPIDKGLFSYDVFQDNAADPFGFGTGGQYLLASTPDATFFELPSIVTGAQQLWHTTAGTWLDRTADLRSAAFEVCSGGLKDEVCTQSGVTPGAWVRIVGQTSERSPDQQSFGLFGRTFTYDTSYDQNSYGILGGFDFGETVGNTTWMAGVFGGYVGSDLEFDNSTTSVDYSTGVVGAYATYLQGGLFADGKIVAQFGEADYSSSADQGITANNSADVTSIGGVLEVGYRAHFDGATFIEPGATLAYVDADVDDLNIFGHTAQFGNGESLRGRLGLRLGTTLHDMSTKFEPFVGVSAWQEFSADNEASVTSNGVTLTAQDDAEGTIGEVSLGLNIFDTTGTGVSGFVKGDAQFGENDFEAYSGNAGFRVKF
jgi:outer membrane autotransporter protein